jgi:hypothetical protein
MSNWDNLFDDEPKKVEKKKVESTRRNVEPTPKKVESTITNEISPNKVLDINALYAVLCDLRGQFGIDPLFALLTGKSVQGVSHLSKDIVYFHRTPAAEGIIKLFRKLKSEGYF